MINKQYRESRPESGQTKARIVNLRCDEVQWLRLHHHAHRRKETLSEMIRGRLADILTDQAR